MHEVSSHVCLDLPTAIGKVAQKIVPIEDGARLLKVRFIKREFVPYHSMMLPNGTRLQLGVPYCCKANGLVCPAGVKAPFVRK